MKNTVLFILCLILPLQSCKKSEVRDYNNLSNLPTDKGGKHLPFILGSTDSPYGFYIYTPSEPGPEYPLLIFLHGAGEKGNSSSNPILLDMVLRHGPPKLIQGKKWSPVYPMIVVSPQCHENSWDPAKIHRLIKFLLVNFKVNKKRIYLTGLSMGGFGTFNYLTAAADSGLVAAAVPICGGGNASKAEEMKHIPLWAFHGDSDEIVDVSASINMVNAINSKKPPVRAKLTLYPGVGHDSWTRTYDGSGMGTESEAYDPFAMDIYRWMLQYEWHQFAGKK